MKTAGLSSRSKRLPNETPPFHVKACMRLLTLVFLTGLIFAQDAQKPSPEIHGTVAEFGTHYGIAGAQVELLLDGQTQPVLTATTDSQGAYDLHPAAIGHYIVRVQVEGYKSAQGAEFPGAAILFAAQSVARPASTETRVVITNGNPREQADFTFVRPGELRGRVVDEETGQPLAKVPVNWVSPNKGAGVAYFGSQAILTDNEGQFVFPSVLPGNYAIEVHPVKQIMAKFTEDDAAAVDQGLETTFWPGGRDFNSSATFPLGAGQSLNVGAVKVRGASYYRLRVNVTPGCPSDQTVNLQLIPIPADAERLQGSVPCGPGFLITNVSPGSYSLQVTSGPLATRAITTTPVEIRDRNVTVTAALENGIEIDARLVVADGVELPPMNQITAWVVPVEQPGAVNTPQTPDGQGRFRVSNLPGGRASVSVIRAPDGFYLREIRYNGEIQPASVFAVELGAPTQSLELVLDNKPGGITGVVEDNDNPVNMPCVVVAKWPYSREMSYSQRIFGGTDGKFKTPGLSPGEYRIVAVSDENKDKLSDPAVLERLLPSAEKVTLDRGASQDVRLKLTDPNR